MSESTNESAKLWALIVSCGLEQEHERDWLGRIRNKRSKIYLRVDATPEFVQMIANANATLAAAQSGTAGALTAARDAVKSRLKALERSSAP